MTKLEALRSRGADDLLSSRDFEDIVLMADGREELWAEVQALPAAAAGYVRSELQRVQAIPAYEYAVEGALSRDGRSRARAVTMPRLERLAISAD